MEQPVQLRQELALHTVGLRQGSMQELFGQHCSPRIHSVTALRRGHSRPHSERVHARHTRLHGRSSGRLLVDSSHW